MSKKPEIRATLSEYKQMYPLLKKGYDPLNCPRCGTTCYPFEEKENGTIVYNRHRCTPPIMKGLPVFTDKTKQYSFKINIDGELVGYP